MTDAVSAPLLRLPMHALMWLAGPSMAPDDPSDMLATIAAEDAFDVGSRLDRIQAPTLVLGGAKDPFYSVDLFRGTAAGVRDGRAVVFPGRGHLGVVSSRVAHGVALGFFLGEGGSGRRGTA